MAKRPMKERIFSQPPPIKPKVEKAKMSVKERINTPSPIEKKNVEGKDWDMIVETSSKSEDDFEVFYNIVSVLLVEYDVVNKVTDVEKEYIP